MLLLFRMPSGPGEEDGRAFIGNDGRTLDYNKRRGAVIDIRMRSVQQVDGTGATSPIGTTQALRT
mgnify:CR=1 FL=1